MNKSEAVNKQLVRRKLVLLFKKIIRQVRDRADEVNGLMVEIRNGILKFLAPIIPFTTEKIWQDLLERDIVKEESIHLSKFPEGDKSKINSELEKEFEKIMKFIELGLAERDKAKIGLRWPLASVTIYDENKMNEKFNEIIERQLNVKKVLFKKSKDIKVEIDTTPNKELEAEGFAREIARKIQSERKNTGLKKGEMIELTINLSKKLEKDIKPYMEFIKERTNSNKLNFSDGKIDNNLKNKEIVFTIKDDKIGICFVTD